jgi:hypothetical protein
MSMSETELQAAINLVNKLAILVHACTDSRHCIGEGQLEIERAAP